MGTPYDTDIVAWANEQAEFLRSRNWSALDVESIAEEIEGVARAEERELEIRMTGLIIYLLKWHVEKQARRAYWPRQIETERHRVQRFLTATPSLRTVLTDPEWLEFVWGDAFVSAVQENEIDEFPMHPIWTVQQILDPGFLPD